MRQNEINMFWAYGNISKLEIICINSFIDNGYIVNMWTYGGIKNLPAAVQLRDASDIIEEKRVFTYKNGSYAAFADYFRYKLLAARGGFYADTDVVCLKKYQHLDQGPFLVLERIENTNNLQININLIYHPRPKSGDIIDLALGVTEKFRVDLVEWGDCGPKLVTALAVLYPQLAPEVKNADFVNSIDYWNCPRYLLEPGRRISNDAEFLHLYNEMWRRSGVDKNLPYPTDSIMDHLSKKYL